MNRRRRGELGIGRRIRDGTSYLRAAAWIKAGLACTPLLDMKAYKPQLLAWEACTTRGPQGDS